MSDIEITVDGSQARKEINEVAASVEKLAAATGQLSARGAAKATGHLNKLSAALGVAQASAGGAAHGVANMTKTYHLAGSAGAGLVNSQDQLSAATRRFARSVAILQGPLGPIAGRITMLGVAVGDVGVVMTTLGVSVTAVAATLLMASRAGSAAEVQFAKMNAVLTATNGTANQTSESVEAMARNIGRYTLASTQEVRTAATQMLTFRKITEDSFGRAMTLAQDLAAVGFGSLEGAARQLARALEDPEVGLTSLRRAGVSFTRAQRDMIVEMYKSGQVAQAQGLILDEVAKQVGGAGVAAAIGIAGAFDTLGEEFKLFLEAIGTGRVYEAIASSFSKIASVLRTLHENVETLVTAFKSLAQAIAVTAIASMVPMLWGWVAAAAAATKATLGLAASTGVLAASTGVAAAAGRGLLVVLGFLARHPLLIAVAALTAGFFALNRTMAPLIGVAHDVKTATGGMESTLSRVMDTIFDKSGVVREGTIFTEAYAQIKTLDQAVLEHIRVLDELERKREAALRNIEERPTTAENIFGEDTVLSRLTGWHQIEKGVVGAVAAVKNYFVKGAIEAGKEGAEALVEAHQEMINSLQHNSLVEAEKMIYVLEGIGTETSIAYSQGLKAGMAEFDEGFTTLGQFLEYLESIKRSMQDIWTPTINVDSITSGLTKAMEAAAPAVDRAAAPIIGLASAIGEAESAASTLSTTTAELSSKISFLEREIASTQNYLRNQKLGFEERAAATAYLSKQETELAKTVRSRADADASAASLSEQAAKASDILGDARGRVADEIREQVKNEENLISAMHTSAKATQSAELRTKTTSASLEISGRLLAAYGENWRDVSEAVELYNRYMANVQRLPYAEEMSKRIADGELFVETLRMEVEERRLLAQGIEITADQKKMEEAATLANALGQHALAEQIRMLIAEYLELGGVIDAIDQKKKNEEASEALIRKIDKEYRAMAELRDMQMEIYRLREIGTEAGGISDTEAERLLNLLKEGSNQASEFAKLWEEALKRVDGLFVDLWESAFKGFKDFAESLKNTFRRLLAEMAHAALTRPIVISIMSSGAMGGAGTAAAGSGGISGMGGMGNLLGGAGPAGFLNNLVHGSATGPFQTATGAGMFGGSAMGFGLSGLAGGFIGSQFGGHGGIGGSIGGMAGFGIASGGSALGATLGAAFGSAAPIIGTAIGAVLGGLLGGLFGSDTPGKKGQRAAWTESVDLSTGVAGELKGGDPKLEGPRDMAIAVVQSAVAGIRALGGEVTGTLEELGIGYRKGWQVMIEGTMRTFGEDFNAMFAHIMDYMIRSTEGLSEPVEALILSAETFEETMRRMQLIGAMGPVNAVLERLNLSAFELVNSVGSAANSVSALDQNLKTLADVEHLITLFGGLDNMLAQTGAYYQAFFSEAERIEHLTNDVTNAFAELGMAMPVSNAEFRSVVESLDLTTESGRETFAAMMGLAGAFNTITTYVGEATLEVEDFGDVLEERARLERELLTVQGDTAALRELELAALHESNRALQLQIWAQEELNAIENERTRLEKELLQIVGDTTSLRELELAALHESNRALQLEIWATEEAIAAADALSEALLNMEEQMGRISSERNRDPFAEAAPVTQTEAYRKQHSELMNLIRAYDGSLDATIELTDAYASFQDSTRDLVSSLEEVSAQVTALFGNLMNQITEDLIQDEKELYDYRRAQVDVLVAALATMSDPEQILNTAREIERLTSTMWGSLDDYQKSMMGEDFLTFLQDVNALVQDRIQSSLQEIEDHQNQVNAEIDDILQSSVIRQEEAANTMLIAAQEMMTAASNMNLAVSGMQAAVSSINTTSAPSLPSGEVTYS